MAKSFSAKKIFSRENAGDILDIMGALKRVGAMRAMSVITSVVTLVAAVFIYVVPALSSQAASTNDIIFGGLDRAHPKESLLQVYDNDRDSYGHTGYHTLFAHYGITRANLASARIGQVINSSNQDLLSLGRNPHSSEDVTLNIGGQIYYQRPLSSWGSGISYDVIAGQTADGTWFAVMYECGNIVIHRPPPPPPPATFDCIDLAADAHQGKIPLDVHFVATAEVKRTTVTDFIFKFGDGSAPVISGDHLAHHVYQKAGNFTATVQVKTPLGTTPVKTVCSTPVHTTTTPPPDFDCVSLTADQTSGDIPLNVHFNAAASVSRTSVKDFIFKFGDGSAPVTSGDHLAHHIYTKVGTYTATVQVETPLGTTAVKPACSVTIKPSHTPPPPVPHIVLAKSALNLTQLKNGKPIDATTKPAHPGDVIEYHLTTKNTGDGVQKDYVARENINDILEYADLVNAFGGSLNNGILTWPKTNIAPHSQVVVKFRVKVKNPLPTTPRSSTDPKSFDLQMDNVYGNKVTVKLVPPAVKVVEAVATTLPQTGNALNIAIMAIFTALAAFFFFRNRQLVKEVKVLQSYYGPPGQAGEVKA